MRVLNLNDYRVKSLRMTHPELRGAKVLGSGQFATVFDDGDPDTVLKLTTDKYSYAYLTDGCAPDKAHAPKVIHKFGCVGQTSKGDDLYLVRIERLYPIEVGSPLKRLVRQIRKKTYYGARFAGALFDDIEMPKTLRTVFHELEWFLLNVGGEYDCGTANFMRRADGTLILSDPVYDYRRQCQLYRERYSFAI